MIDPFTGASAAARFFLSVGKFIGQAAAFLAKPAVQLGLMVAQGVMSHQAAMKAKRTGADILLQKYGTGGGIPVIYGTRRVAGTVVYMETQNNRELYVVYAIAAHELDSFDLESIQLDGRTVKDTNIYRQGYDISDGTTRIQFRPSGGTTTRTSGTFWGNTSTERANITGGANINNKARMTFNCHKGTTTQAADPMLEGILTDWTSNHKLTGIAYIAANYEYDTQGMFTGIPNLTIVVNGKKVFDPRDTGQTFGTESTYTHSSNAALCLLDYITNDDYGKGLGSSDLESDFASWKTAANDCDTSVDTIDHTGISVESASTDSDVMIIASASQAKFNKLKVGNKYTVDDGTTTYVNNKKLIDKDSTQIDIDGSNAFAILKLKFEDGAIDNAITSATSCDFAETQIRFDCNGVLDTKETVLENTKLLIANMRGIFTYANGKYQIKVEGTESSVVTLDEDDILESGITLSLENKEAKYNKVEAEFYNAQKRYESDTTYYTGESGDTFLADDGNEVLETRIQLPFCTNQRIAYNHAKGLLKRSRKQKTISFVATPKVLKAKVGEVITISNTNLNLSSELYRITNMTINPDLNVAVTAIEYQTDVYGYATPPDEDIDIPDDPPEGNRVVAPTNLTFTNKNATTGEAAKLTWTDSTKYPSYEFRVRIIDGLKTRYDKRVKDTYFYLDGISVANGYEAKVSAINALGVESDSTDITVNVTTEPVTTPDIKDGSITADKILANTITANEIASGTITATELDANSVTADKINVTDLAAISADLGSITAGSLNINSGQFVVTSAGAMTAQSATITGSVTSSSGTIGGFTLGNNFLTAGSDTNRIKLSTADGIHMGKDIFADAPFSVSKGGTVTAKDLILKKGNVTYFDSTDGFSAEAIAQIASSLNTRVQTFAFSSENNTDYATIETTEDSQDIKLVVRANASSLQGSGTSEALAIAEIPDNLTIKIEFDDNTSFTSPTTIGSLQTYNASTDGTPLASEYEIQTLDLSELGGDFSAFVLGNDGAVNASGDIVYTVSSYTVATAGTYYFRVIYDTTDTSYNATNDPENFTRSLEIEDLSGSGFLISNGSSGAQTSDAVTLTGTQTITGAKTFSATTTFSGDVNISGDLSVTGTTTTIDTATLNVEDKNITLNYSTGDSSSTANGAGITIQDAVNSTTDATITWDATNDEFDFSHKIQTPSITTPAITVNHTSGYGNIEMSGTSGAYLDLKSPSTDDYDIRIITTGTGGIITSGSGEVTIQRQGATKLATSSTGISVTGTVSATSFSGDGSGLTGITSTTINNNADNRIITGSGTANTLNAEANLTFDGSVLDFGSSNATVSGVGVLGIGVGVTTGSIITVNGTEVMNVGRNLTNIGTITASGDMAIDTDTLFVDVSANRVGIGEDSVDMKLHISDSTTPGIKFERPGVYAWRAGVSGTSFIFSRTSDTLASPVLRLEGNDNATFAGNVYIGSADTTGGLLTIHGNGTGNNEGGEIRLATSADHDGVYDFYRIDVNSDDLRFGRQGETDLTIKNTGSVEIGQHIDGLVFPNSHSEDKIRLYKGGSEKIGTASGVLVLTGNSINFKKVGGAPDLQHNGTVFLNSARDLTNIVAFTSSGDFDQGGTNNRHFVTSAHDLTSGDLNTMWSENVAYNKSGGIQPFRYSSGATNKPVTQDNANWGLNIYSHPGSTSSNNPYGIQFAGANSDTKRLYVRGFSNGSAGAWLQVPVGGNVANPIDFQITGVMRANNGYKLGATTFLDNSLNAKNIASLAIDYAGVPNSSNLHVSGGKITIASTSNGYGQIQVGNTSTGEASVGYFSGVTESSIGGTGSSMATYQWATGLNVYGIGANTWGIGNKTNSDVLRLDVSGNLSVDGTIKAGPGGSVSAPIYSFDGDTDTGMFRTAANQLAFATGGAQCLVFGSNQDATFNQNVTANGYIQAFGFLYTRNNLRVLNASGTNWNTWAERSNGNYNLNVGTISSGAISSEASTHYLGGIKISAENSSQNYIAFAGTTGDQPGNYNHSYIGERIYSGTERSELVLAKYNDLEGSSGSDRIRMIGNNIVFDTYSSTITPSVGASLSTAVGTGSPTTKMTIEQDGDIILSNSAKLKGAVFYEALNAGNTDATATSPRFYSPSNGKGALSAGGASRLEFDSGAVTVGATNGRLNLTSATYSFGTSFWAGTGGYPGYQFTGGNSRFGFSSTAGVVDVYIDGNYYATDSSHKVWHAGDNNLSTSGSPSFTQVSATSNADANGYRLRAQAEVISGESWCTGFYNYNVNDGALFLRRNSSGTALPHFHISGYNNPGYAGHTDGDGMVTLTRSTSGKAVGSTYAGTGLQNTADWSRWIKTSSATIFEDGDDKWQFGVNGDSPLITLFYNDHGNGPIWDTAIEIGKSNNFAATTTSAPVYTPTGAYGIQFKANSDGCFYGIQEYTTGNFRPLINWGDDTTDSPFTVAFNGSTKFQFAYNGAFTASNNITAYSDIKLKENIEVIDNAVEKIQKIRGVTFTRNDQKDTDKKYAGVIAQEVEKVLPEVVDYNEETDTKTVAYGNMVGLLIEAIKEQQKQIDELKAKLK